MAYDQRKLTPEEMAELHSLPDESVVTAREAAAVLRVKPETLAYYRCEGGGPPFTRVGPKQIRYRMGDLREYLATPRRMGEGMRKVADAMLAARVAKGQVARG